MKLFFFKRLMPMLVFLSLGLTVFAQTDILIKESDLRRTNGKFELGGKLFAISAFGERSESQFQLSEVKPNGDLELAFVSPKNRNFREVSNTSSDGVILISYTAHEGLRTAFVTFLDNELKVKWEHEIKSEHHLHPTSIVNAGRNGCYLAIIVDDEMKLIHFTQNGHIDRSHNFGYRPVHNFYAFQIDMTNDGLFGVLTTRSHLSMVVNSCTPDFDFMGFKWAENGNIDTLFFEDVDPYHSYTRYQILPSRFGGKNLMWRVDFAFDPEKSSYGGCNQSKGEYVNFINMVPSAYPLQHSNKLVYIPTSYSLFAGSTSDYRKAEMNIDSLGLPQRLIAAWEEDAVIWNTFQSEEISKIDFEGKTVWTTKIPSPESTTVIVTKIGYLSSGGYYLITQEKESAQEHIFKLSVDGNWI